MRAEKRKKNEPKELARLKATLGHGGTGDISMKDVEQIATVVPVEKLKAKAVDVEMQGEDGEFIHDALLFALPKVRGTRHNLTQCYLFHYILRRVNNGHGQQTEEKNPAGRTRTVPDVDEPEADEKTKSKTQSKERKT